MHDPTFRKHVTDFIDNIVTCKIPKEFANAEPVVPRPIIAAQLYPSLESLKADAAKCRLQLQTHKHAVTCWKRKNSKKCRMAMKRQLALETYIYELEAAKN